MRCVQFVPYEIIHRATSAMANNKGKKDVWKEEFEEYYNVKFGQLKANLDTYTMIFPSDKDYTMFMLRWS